MSAAEYVRNLYWQFERELAEEYFPQQDNPARVARTSIPQAAAMLALATAYLEIELCPPLESLPTNRKRRVRKSA